MKKLWLTLGIAVMLFNDCCKYQYPEKITTRYFNLNDTTSIHVKQTLINQADNISITFDSVKNDSRCPTGAECDQVGNAVVVFHYTKDYNSVYFTLNTLSTMGNDSTIDHYNIKLITLLPYPSIHTQMKPDEYVSKLWVSKN